MKKVLTLLLTLVLMFTALFSYAPNYVYAEEEASEETVAEIYEEATEEEQEEVPDETVLQEVEELPQEEDLPIAEEMTPLPANGEENEDHPLFVSQDENHNVVITSDVEGLMDYCANNDVYIYVANNHGTYRIENGIYYENNTYGDLRYKNRYYSVETGANGNRYISITYDDLKANNIPGGEGTFSIDYGDTLTSNAIDLVACNEAPQNITVTEEGDDLVISGDSDFLQALLYPELIKMVKTESLFGSYIQIETDNYYVSEKIQINQDVTDGFDVFTNIIRYDEDSDTLRVSSNVLKGKHVMNGDSAVVTLCANGYEKTSVTLENGIALGCSTEKVPFTISQNEDGDIVIVSENTDWLRALVAQREYNNAGTNVFGSSFYADSSDYSKYISASNFYYNTPHFPNLTQTHLYLSEDETYVYIPFSSVKAFQLEEGMVFEYFSLTVLGYEYNTYDFENDGIRLEITKGSEDAPTDITVSELENGDIRIFSENKEWLSTLITATNAWTDYVMINQEPNDGDLEDDSWRNFKNSTFASARPDLVFDGEYVIVKHTAICSNEVLNGLHTMRFVVEGYAQSADYEIVLSHACVETPAEISVESNSYGDVIVSSPYGDWINRMVNGYTEEGFTYRGRIDFYDSIGNWIAAPFNGYSGHNFVLSDDGLSFVIPNTLLQAANIVAGDYRLKFTAYGYYGRELDELVTVNEYVEHDYSYAVLTDDGDFILFKSYEEYMESEEKQDVVDICDNTYHGYVYGDIDTTEYTNKAPWINHSSEIYRFYVADGQTVSPYSMSFWFKNCSNLTSLDFTNLDFSRLTSLTSTFENCTSLIEPDLSGLYTDNVENMAGMFAGCRSLVSLDLSSFNTENVWNMQLMFDLCPSLTTLNLSSFTTNESTSMFDMFNNCSSLTSIYLGPNWRGWNNNSYLPSGNWSNGEEIKTEKELYNQYPDNADMWCGWWTYKTPDLNVSQDENHDVIITSDVEGLMDYCANNDIYIYVSNSHGTFTIGNGIYENVRYKNLYFDVVDGDDGSRYISITYDDLKANNILSGESTFKIDFGQTLFSNAIDLVACNEAPQNITVTEEGDDLVISGDSDFLQALLYPELNKWVKSESLLGSYIQISSDGYVSDRIQIIKNNDDGFDVFTNIIRYDEDSDTLRISSNVLKGNHVMNGDSAIVTLRANGYEKLELAMDDGITLGCRQEKVPFTISQNENGDIIIASENTDWLRALVAVKEYNNAGTNKFGSSLYADSTDYSKYISVSNYYYNTPSFPNITQTQLYLSEDETYVYIPFSSVKAFQLEEGMAFESFSLMVLGYEFYTYDYENDGVRLEIVKGSEDAPTDITVSELENGDIRVFSENKEWLSTLATATNDWANIVQINQNTNDGDLEDDSWRNFKNSTFASASPVLVYDGEYVTVGHSSISNNEVLNGMHTIRFIVAGYSQSADYEIELSHACVEPPTDINVVSNSYGDVIVSSSDSAWIDRMFNGYPEGTAKNSGRIEFFDAAGSWVAAPFNGFMGRSFTLSDDGLSFVIPNTLLQAANIVAEEYSLKLYAYGYSHADFDSLTVNEFVEHKKEAPADVEIVENEDGDIVVSSFDSEWLQTLASEGSYIVLENENNSSYLYYNEYEDSFVLADDVLSVNVVNSFILYEGVMNGTYDVTICVEGYENYAAESKLVLSKATKAAPAEEDISIDCIDDSIIISSEDAGWLESLAEYREYNRIDGENPRYYLYQPVIGLYCQNGNEYYDLYNVRYLINGEAFEVDTKVVYENNRIIIPADVVRSLGIASGHYSVNFSSNGYSGVYTEVDLETSVQAEPADVEVTLDDAFTVSSQDGNWIEGIFGQSDETGIRLDNWEEDEYSNETYRNSQYYDLFDITENSVSISLNNLINYNQLGSGNYSVSVRSYGYSEYRHTTTVYINGVSQIPDDLSVFETGDGDLLISSEDKNYLSALTVNSELKDGKISEIGGRIFIGDPKKVSGNAVKRRGAGDDGLLINLEGKEMIRYENGNIVISAVDLAEIGIADGHYDVYVMAPNYSEASLPLDYSAPQFLEVSQDEDGNISIMTEDSAILDYYASNNADVYLSTGDRDYLIGRDIYEWPGDKYDNYYYEVRRNNEGNQYIFISADVLKARNIPSGAYQILLQGNGTVLFSQSINIVGCHASVEVSVQEENGKLAIRADEDFLRALMEASTRSEVYDAKSHYGSRVCFVNTDGHVSEEVRNEGEIRDYGSGQFTVNMDWLEYDEANGVVYVSEMVLKGKDVVNGENVTASFVVNGYETFEVQVEGGISLGCVAGKVDFAIEQNDNGDIVFTSDDKGWLRALCVSREYGDNGRDLSLGSSISFFSNETFDSSYFNNQTHIEDVSGLRHPEICIYYDEDEEFAYIPYDEVLRHNIRKGVTYDVITFWTYGYQNNSYNYTDDGIRLVAEKGSQDYPSDITVEELDSGDIRIWSADKEWLQLLTTENDDGGYYVEIQQKAGFNSYNRIRNASYYSRKNLVFDGDCVIIPHESIMNFNLNNGVHELWICVYGYSQTEPMYVELHYACKDAPVGVTIEENNNGDLVIRSEDPDWMNLLAMGFDGEKETGRLTFWDGYSHAADIVSGRDGAPFELSNDRKTLTVPNSMIISSNVPNGTFSVELYVYGYETFNIDNVTITKGCIPAPSDVTIESIDDEIIIHSENTDWLEALAQEMIYYHGSEGEVIRQQGGTVRLIAVDDEGQEIGYQLFLRNERHLWENEEPYVVTNLIYDTDARTLTIPKDLVMSYGITSGSYRFILMGYGYTSRSLLKYISTTIRDDIPEDLNISFDEERGLIFTAGDPDYLEAIVDGSITLNLNGEVGYYFNNNEYHRPLRLENGDAVIDLSYMYEQGVVSGEYLVVIEAYGFVPYRYGYYVYSEDKVYDGVEVEGIKDVPEDVLVSQSEDGKLIIESEDQNFLKALTAEWKYYMEGDDVVGVERFGANLVIFTDEDGAGETYERYVMGLENNIYGEPIVYNEAEGRIEIDIDQFRHVLKHDIYRLDLNGFGYRKLNVLYNFCLIPQIGVLFAGENYALDTTDVVEWLIEDESVAAVTDGVLYAKKAGTTKLTAVFEVEEGRRVTDSVQITVISDQSTKLILVSDLGNEVNVGDTANLSLQTDSGAAIEGAVFTSSDESKATVSQTGVVTFNAAGTVTIKAEAFGMQSSLKYTVYSAPKNDKLTASVSNYEDARLEVGDTASFIVEAGSGAIIDSRHFTFASSNKKTVTVDENGTLTAVSSGSATITATLINDPQKRKVSYTVKVVNRIAKSLDLDVDDNAHAVIDRRDNGVYIDYLTIDSSDKIHISATVTDKLDAEFTPASVKYASTDTTIAAVDANGYVAFKKPGQVTVTCTIASNPTDEPLSEEIILRAVEYTPKIESAKITVNRYLAEDTFINVYPVYDSQISAVSLADTGLFKAEMMEDGRTVRIQLLDRSTAAKTYVETLKFTVNGEEYAYKVSVSVTSALPAVTVKTAGSYNTFTCVNTLGMEYTSKTGEFRDVEFVDDWADYDAQSGMITLKEKDGKLVKTGTVRFFFEGYTDEGHVDKKVSFKTVSTKPTVKLANTSVSLYVPEGDTEAKTVSVKLIDAKKEAITEGIVTVDGLGSELISELDENGSVSLRINEVKKGTVVISYKEEEWTGTINNKLSVTIKTTLPTAKLKSSTLTLNSKYSSEGIAEVLSSSASDPICLVECKEVPAGLEVETLAGGEVAVRSKTPGTYKVSLVPSIEVNERLVELKPVTLTVKVNSNDPKFALSSSTFKLNSNYNEDLEATVKLTSNTYNLELTGIRYEAVDPANDIAKFELDDDGKVHISLAEYGKTLNSGSYKYDITPIYSGDIPADSALRVTVTIYRKDATATVSVKGTLNPIDPDQEALGTIKLTNYGGKVADVNIKADAAHEASPYFETELNEEGKAVLRLANAIDDDGVTLVKDGSHKVILDLTLSDGSHIEKEITIKTARKAPTLKLDPTTVNVYDTTVIEEEVGRSAFVLKGNGTVRDVEIPEALAYVANYEDGELIVILKDGALLKSGSTVKFAIKVNWVGDYAAGSKGMKTSTVTLSVKDLSGAIKTK